MLINYECDQDTITLAGVANQSYILKVGSADKTISLGMTQLKNAIC